jgi:hypothetical protein
MKLATGEPLGAGEGAALPSIGALRMDEVFGYAVFTLMILSIAVPFARHLNYGLPLVALLLILANRKLNLPDIARPYLVLIAAGLLLAPLVKPDGWQDLYLVLTGCAAGLVGLRTLWSWRTVFLALVLGQCLLLVSNRLGGGEQLAGLEFDFLQSTSSFESNFSFLFGLVAVWAAYTRRWTAVVVALLCALVTLKRIALLGAVICIAVQFLPAVLRRALLKPLPMLAFNGLFLVLILLYGSGELDYLITSLTSQSPNELGMGRQTLHRYIVLDVLKDPWRFALIGAGPGEAYDAMKASVTWAGKANLHADTLKILYEYGAVTLIAFIWALYSSRHPAVLMVALYTNVLLLTDNTLIYPFYIYFATLVAASMIAAERQKRLARLKPPTDEG